MHVLAGAMVLMGCFLELRGTSTDTFSIHSLVFSRAVSKIRGCFLELRGTSTDTFSIHSWRALTNPKTLKDMARPNQP